MEGEEGGYVSVERNISEKIKERNETGLFVSENMNAHARGPQ